ncbi:MAG TPA: sigma-70 family RNA polymerase sigma factor [Vicinamibacterales bacterium]|nr:sigma-70 family RNA polymerase sigma factor [Vicinamibacterales bacterium]
MGDTPGDVTRLLQAWRHGDTAALEQLTPIVYDELRRLAARYMRRERPGHTLQTSALINEAYLRLVDARGVQWQNRAHFFGVSAQVMRHILVDFARARQNLKRGGGAQPVSLDAVMVSVPERGTDLLALDEALERLAALSPRQSRVVELRYFGGLTEEEVAEVLSISPRTVRNDWGLARAWLYRELTRDA